ncbi:MAG: hypothetical protein ACLRRQ_05095 [Lachnospira pectinoschiza]
MVDSSYFKNNKNNGNRAGGKNNGKLMDRLKQHKWIPLVVIIVLALAMIAIQYFMLDVLPIYKTDGRTAERGIY